MTSAVGQHTERPGLWEWDGHGFVPADEPGASAQLLAADSWLVENGGVRALARHCARFSRACREIAAVEGDAAERLARAVAQPAWPRALARLLPRAGKWFPRVELVRARTVRLLVRVRPAPARGLSAEVWVPPTPDPRAHPLRKGPDLARLAELRSAALAHGAQEALLTTPAGWVVEAANSTLLWWEGEVLCVPEAGLGVFPGITAELVREEAGSRGVPVRERRVRAAELAAHEVWLTNALHGLRRVSGWRRGEPDGGTLTTTAVCGDLARFSAWRQRLEGLRAPLS